jgi:hypothetical protein
MIDWLWIKMRRKEKQENEILEKSTVSQTTKYLLDRFIYIEKMLAYGIDYKSREKFEKESYHILDELNKRGYVYLDSCGCVRIKNVEYLINS